MPPRPSRAGSTASAAATTRGVPEREPARHGLAGPRRAARAAREGAGHDPPPVRADDAGREPGEILLQTGFSWAESEEQALEGARVWKGAGPPEYYVDDWHDPAKMYEHAEAAIDDAQFRELQIISADPEVHAERVRAVEQLGATTVVLMNISGADPLGAIETYAERVLPAVRGRRRQRV